MVAPEVAEAVGGENHGRLGMSAILHGLDPAIDWASKLGLTLAVMTFVVVIVDLAMRGRLRQTAFAFTHLLACLPLIGALHAASQGTVNYWLAVPADDSPLGNFPLIQAAVAVLMGSFLSGLGVILTFVLRLDDAWRGRKGDHPRATNT
jgi:hypothetical protein